MKVESFSEEQSRGELLRSAELVKGPNKAENAGEE